jgi:hypothetical protein
MLVVNQDVVKMKRSVFYLAVSLSIIFNLNAQKMSYSNVLTAYLDRIEESYGQIPEERKQILGEIAGYIKKNHKSDHDARLIFICTHNSRRSHMSQLWASLAADYYGIKGIQTFSGGTEATAFNPRAVKAMNHAGWIITPSDESENPVYLAKFKNEQEPQKIWSKKYGDAENPQERFAAIMTCSEADENCPVVFGANARISLPYFDPKEADGTPEETARYDERCFQIATEMMYLFSMI